MCNLCNHKQVCKTLAMKIFQIKTNLGHFLKYLSEMMRMTCKLDDSDRQSVTFDLQRPDRRSTKITPRPRFVTSTAWKWF